MEWLAEYGLFLAKAVTWVLAILVLMGSIATMAHRHRRPASGHLEIRSLNDRLDEFRDTLRHAIEEPAVYRQRIKAERKAEKAAEKAARKKAKKFFAASARAAEHAAGAGESAPSAESHPPILPESSRPPAPSADIGVPAPSTAEGDAAVPGQTWVLDFDGDMRASQVDHLREEISAILTIAEKNDEVVLRLESPGGLVHGYGLAASQLDRIRGAGLKLTICIDKVAASGGYMMACLGDRILAAPFAVVGSIGVVAQLPNFHRLLKKHDVDFEVLTAGEYKRTLTVFGENTEQGRAKYLEDLEETHSLFKQWVGTHRPVVDIEAVSRGEVWYGQQAVANQLVDGLMTSDSYLQQRASVGKVHLVRYKPSQRLAEKIGISMATLLESGVLRAQKAFAVR